MAIQQNTLYIRIRLKQGRQDLDGLSCQVNELDSDFSPQGRNPDQRGWQPYLLTVYPPRSGFPDTLTFTFDRDVTLGRVELLQLEA